MAQKQSLGDKIVTKTLSLSEQFDKSGHPVLASTTLAASGVMVAAAIAKDLLTGKGFGPKDGIF